jgi:uncharacterized membrane protein YeaQ/YmgE (transglycosylase-associated protein family)
MRRHIRPSVVIAAATVMSVWLGSGKLWGPGDRRRAGPGHRPVSARIRAGAFPQLPARGIPQRVNERSSMGIIAFIILGLLAGAIAKAIMPGDDPGGIIVTTIIGIVGALLGGFLASALFGGHPLDEFFDVSTWLTAIVGSIILLAIYRAVIGNRHGGVRV